MKCSKCGEYHSIFGACPSPPPSASGSGDWATPAYRAALSLALALWRRHYQKESPNWKPLLDTEGLISQIDNMAAGLSNRLDAMRATVQPNDGQIIINAIIRAGAILTIEKTSEDSAIIVWHANAAEQIEAALSEAGFTLSQNPKFSGDTSAATGSSGD